MLHVRACYRCAPVDPARDHEHERQEAMIDLQALGCDKIASFGQNVVHAMQFKRITAESHMSSAIFSEEGEALRWIHERRSPGT
jgi:hypothetical protein